MRKMTSEMDVSGKYEELTMKTSSVGRSGVTITNITIEITMPPRTSYWRRATIQLTLLTNFFMILGCYHNRMHAQVDPADAHRQPTGNRHTPHHPNRHLHTYTMRETRTPQVW